MRVATVRTVLPDNYYEQREITEAVTRWWPDVDGALLERFHAATRVRGRHLALPIDEYAKLDGFTAANDAYIDIALDLTERAVRGALEAAALRPADVDHLVLCSSTGLATPSLDARLAQRAGLRGDVRRVPIFGLGCAAGAAGLSRLHDYLRGRPDDVAVLVCVELCSLTVQPDDVSLPNLVGSALFGDGAAAVVAVGDGRDTGTGPQVVETRSRLYPDTERLMGWEIGRHGFRIVLAPDLVDTVEAELGGDVATFLGDHGLTVADVASWVCHPGGPRVLEKIVEVLGLDADALAASWRSLRRMGNVSSVSVLNVLEETMTPHRPPAGAPGLLMALGPGFSSELVLLRW